MGGVGGVDSTVVQPAVAHLTEAGGLRAAPAVAVPRAAPARAALPAAVQGPAEVF